MAATCRTCGTEYEADARFCAHCGAALTASAPASEPDAAAIARAEAEADAARGHLSPGIFQGEDGVYRWACDLSLFTNPTILFMLWKIFFWILIGLWLFLLVVDGVNGGFADAFRKLDVFPLYGLAIMFGLTTLGYLAYAVFMGGKYCVWFEMDDEKISHIQAPHQFKRAQLIGVFASLTGAARGDLTMAGQGMMISSRQGMTTHFDRVKRIIPYKRRGVIKVSAFLNHNQVYTQPEDFDAVLAYIRARCPNAR